MPNSTSIFKTLPWAEGDKEKPDSILQKFTDFVRPKNKGVPCFRLRQRKQRDGEAFDNFLKDIRLTLMDCDYTDSNDILVDVIIDGVKHPKVQERLLDKGQNLTLDDAISIVRQFELSQKHLKLIREDDPPPPDIAYIKPKYQKNPKTPKQSSRPNSKAIHTSSCSQCRLSHSSKQKCPAVDSTCKYCKMKGHWLSVCRKRNKSVKAIQEESESESETVSESETDSETLGIHSVTSSESSDKWLVGMSPIRVIFSLQDSYDLLLTIISTKNLNNCVQMFHAKSLMRCKAKMHDKYTVTQC